MSGLSRGTHVHGVMISIVIGGVLIGAATGCRRSKPRPPITLPTTQAATQPASPRDTLIAQLAESLQNDTNPAARAAAAKKLGRMLQKAAPATEALIKALDDPDANVRIKAASALGWIGPQAAAATEPLIKLLDAENVPLRSHAAFSLGQIRSTAAKAAVPRLIEMVQNDHVDVQRRAATALGRLGQGYPAAAPTLIEATKHEDNRVRNEAVLGLRNLGPEASAAGPALVYIIRNDPVDGVRKHAALALGRIQPADRSLAVDGLIDGMRDSYMRTRWESLLSFRSFGPDAAKATPVIAAALDDPEAKIRNAVPMVLKEIGLAALPYLKAILDNPEAAHRANAAAALGMLGTTTTEIVAICIDALSDDDEAVVAAAATALGGLGRGASAALPTLTELTEDPREPVRNAATAAVQSMLRPKSR